MSDKTDSETRLVWASVGCGFLSEGHDYDMVQWDTGEYTAYHYPKSYPNEGTVRLGRFADSEAAKEACERHAKEAQDEQ